MASGLGHPVARARGMARVRPTGVRNAAEPFLVSQPHLRPLFTLGVRGTGILGSSPRKLQQLVHLSDAPTLIEGYVANVTWAEKPHVKVQDRYLPSF